MTDRELFDKVLEKLAERYRLTVGTDVYGVLYLKAESGREIGAMNPNGYNLLANLTRLCEILKGELL